MADLLQGTWTITALLPDGDVPEGSTITFADGRMSFYAGCNRAMGPYTLDGSTLTAGAVAMTLMYCPDMRAEGHLARAFGRPLEIGVAGDELVADGPAGGFTARRA